MECRNDRSYMHVIRHGESDSNKYKDGNVYVPERHKTAACYHRPSSLIDLTADGHAQARWLGSVLAAENVCFDQIQCSTMLRARDTCDQMCESFAEKPEIILQPRIVERQAGYAWGMTEKEAREYFPYLKRYWEEESSFYAVPPGGESMHMVYARVYPWLDDLIECLMYESVHHAQASESPQAFHCGIVAHGGTNKVIEMILQNLAPENFDDIASQKNATDRVYEFDFTGDELTPPKYIGEISWDELL